MPAVSAAMTRSSGSSEAGIASTPIVTSETAGKRPVGCSRANGARKSPSAAAAYGMREAPSSSPYVDANAVIITAIVTAIANGVPNARSATVEAIVLDFTMSAGGDRGGHAEVQQHVRDADERDGRARSSAGSCAPAR